jgi:hypothetical protein
MSNCKQCNQSFEVTAQDRKFYEDVSPVFDKKKCLIPEPTLCPDCRLQRRLAWRNERNLYHRKCDLSGKQIISIYSPEKPFKVFDQDEWWGDKWNPLDYGRDFDFSRLFFEQFAELQKAVPRVSITNTNSVNSEYTNYTANNKNCYLIFSNSYGHNEDCYYGTCLLKSKFCVDNIFVDNSQYLYDCIDCKNSYRLFSSRDCDNCSDSYFLSDCRGCKDCIACKGLRNKQYYIQNKPYSKEAYLEILNKSEFSKNSGYARARKVFDDFDLKTPHVYSRQTNCENSTGDYLTNCRNCEMCFDTTDTENSKYLTYSVGGDFNCYDCSYLGESPNSYENLSLVGGTHCLFNNIVWWNNAELTYTELCFNSQNLFGCIGLNHKKYCILNKQYSKEEYEKLAAKIAAHMQSTGEWGKFFPISMSPFAYNETVAQEYFPLDEKEVQKANWVWKELDEQGNYKGPVYKIPDDIKDVTDDICKQILKCEKSGKLYKIIPQELKFYRDFNLPIPRLSPEQRHLDRIALRNPRRLFDRKCAKCNAPIRTTYAPNRPQIVYCEKCYLKEVY